VQHRPDPRDYRDADRKRRMKLMDGGITNYNGLASILIAGYVRNVLWRTQRGHPVDCGHSRPQAKAPPSAESASVCSRFPRVTPEGRKRLAAIASIHPAARPLRSAICAKRPPPTPQA